MTPRDDINATASDDADDFTIEIGAGDVEDGTYQATLVAIEPLTVEYEDTESGKSEERELVRWVFALEDGRTVRGLTSRASGPKSKMYSWLGQLVGTDALVTGARFSRRDLVGREALVTVGRDRNRFATVTGIVAPPKGASARA